MPADTAHISVRLDNNTSGNVVYFSNLQLEKKDHATPFVHGSRTFSANNITPYGYNITTTNGYHPQRITDSTALGAGAISMNGVDQYLDISDIADLPLNTGITYSVWAYPTSTANWSRFLDVGVGQQNDNIVFSRSGTGTYLFLEVKDGTSNGSSIKYSCLELNK